MFCSSPPHRAAKGDEGKKPKLTLQTKKTDARPSGEKNLTGTAREPGKMAVSEGGTEGTRSCDSLRMHSLSQDGGGGAYQRNWGRACPIKGQGEARR